MRFCQLMFAVLCLYVLCEIWRCVRVSGSSSSFFTQFGLMGGKRVPRAPSASSKKAKHIRSMWIVKRSLPIHARSVYLPNAKVQRSLEFEFIENTCDEL